MAKVLLRLCLRSRGSAVNNIEWLALPTLCFLKMHTARQSQNQQCLGQILRKILASDSFASVVLYFHLLEIKLPVSAGECQHLSDVAHTLPPSTTPAVRRIKTSNVQKWKRLDLAVF